MSPRFRLASILGLAPAVDEVRDPATRSDPFDLFRTPRPVDTGAGEAADGAAPPGGSEVPGPPDAATRADARPGGGDADARPAAPGTGTAGTPFREALVAGLRRPVVQSLRTLARERRTGQLRVLAGRPGSVFLDGGRVVHAAAVGVPGGELLLLGRARAVEPWRSAVGTWPDDVLDPGRAVDLARRVVAAGDVPRLHRAVLAERAVADALWALLGAGGGPAADLRFHPEARAWWTLDAPVAVEAVLDEALRRDAMLADLGDGTHPDLPVWRVAEPPEAPVRLSGRQWDLARLAEGRSPRQLAWRTGAGLFATTLDVARLRAVSLLTPHRAPHATGLGAPRPAHLSDTL